MPLALVADLSMVKAVLELIADRVLAERHRLANDGAVVDGAEQACDLDVGAMAVCSRNAMRMPSASCGSISSPLVSGFTLWPKGGLPFRNPFWVCFFLHGLCHSAD